MLYSRSTNGFYSPELHGTSIPADAVEISDDVYVQLLQAQELGKRITHDSAGRPVAVEYPPLDASVIAASVRDRRNGLLSDSDWTQLPDVPAGTAEVWKPYRQALRDVPAQEGFPDTIAWPERP